MKNKKYLLLILTTVVSIFMLTSCPGASAISSSFTETESSASTETGSVSISVPAISVNLLKALGTSYSGSSVPDSKALILASDVDIYLYDSNNNLVTYAEGCYDDNIDGLITIPLNNIPYGSGYSATANIYNQNVSASPILTGTESMITIKAGHNNIFIHPVPNNAEAITKNNSINASMLSTVYDLANEKITGFGAEKWYSYTPESSGAYTVTAVPNENSNVYIAVYDYSGYLKSNGISSGLAEGTFGGTAATTFYSYRNTLYVGVISIAGSSATNDFTLTVTDAAPASLSFTLTNAPDYNGCNAYIYVYKNYSDDPFTENIAYATGTISNGVFACTALDKTTNEIWKDTGHFYYYVLIDVDNNGGKSPGDADHFNSINLCEDTVMEINSYTLVN